MNLRLPLSFLRRVVCGVLATFSVLALRAAVETGDQASTQDPTTAATAASPKSASPLSKSASPPESRRGGPPTTTGTKNEPARVEVVAVRFSSVNALGNSALNWNETDIEVNVRSSSVKGDSRFVNRVKVTLTLAVEGATGERSHYRASAEAVALEVGRSNFRFYLPPEIVRRDKLRAEAKVYAVEITADAQPMAPVKLASNAPDLRLFLAKAETEVAVTSGILLPQYLTPFAFDSVRLAPSFVRTELTAERK